MFNPIMVWEYLRARLNRDARQDDGVITTEMAVVVFLVVAGAITVVGILVAAATNNAESVPTPSGQ
jgi:uncharacterized Tic20 family protein